MASRHGAFRRRRILRLVEPRGAFPTNVGDTGKIGRRNDNSSGPSCIFVTNRSIGRWSGKPRGNPLLAFAPGRTAPNSRLGSHPSAMGVARPSDCGFRLWGPPTWRELQSSVNQLAYHSAAGEKRNDARSRRTPATMRTRSRVSKGLVRYPAARKANALLLASPSAVSNTIGMSQLPEFPLDRGEQSRSVHPG